MTPDVFKTRRENLRRLAAEWGGPTSLAKKLGHSNGSALSQVIGPHPRRMIGERQARDIERLLQLPLGWLDEEQHGRKQPVKDELLSRVVAAVATCAQDARLTVPPDKFADVCALVYETGQVDETHILRLLRLASR